MEQVSNPVLPPPPPFVPHPYPVYLARWVCAICIDEDPHLPDIGVYFTDPSKRDAYRRAAACCQRMDQELIKRRIQYANERRKARGATARLPGPSSAPFHCPDPGVGMCGRVLALVGGVRGPVHWSFSPSGPGLGTGISGGKPFGCSGGIPQEPDHGQSLVGWPCSFCLPDGEALRARAGGVRAVATPDYRFCQNNTPASQKKQNCEANLQIHLPPPPPGLSERAAPGTSPHGTAGMDPIEYRPSEKHGPHPIAMGAVPLPATSGARASPAPVATTMPIAPRSGPGVAGPVPVPRPLPPALSSTAVVTTRVASKPSATPAVPAPAVSTAAPAPPRAALLAPNTAAVSAVRAGRPPHALPGNEPPSGPKRAPTLPLPAAKVPRVGAESAPQQRRATQQAPARTAKLVVTHEQWMRYDCTVQQHVTDQTGRFSEDWVCFHERLKKCHNPV